MVNKKVIFSFPPSLIEEPITFILVKDYNLQINILRARVDPRESGRMVVELKGEAEDMDRAFSYLEDRGVRLDTMVQEMRHNPDACVDCTACTALCPTGALSVEPETRKLQFDHGKCIICEACIAACSYHALESQF